MRATPASRADCLHLAWIIAIAALLRIIPALNSANWTDLYAQQAYPILEHLNIYKVTHKIFPYSPVSMFFPALCAILSSSLEIPFHIFMRLPAIIADIAINIVLYLTMLRRGRKAAILCGLFYAVNPISILISSFHGNIIIITTLFTFLAYTVLIDNVDKNYRLSALLLGVGIGFRSYPVLLLPFFALLPALSREKKIKYVLYALIPTLLSFIPFLIIDAKSLMREILFYSGWPDHGFCAIIRAVYSLKTSILQYNIPHGAALMDLGKYLFIIVYLAMLVIYRNKKLIVSILSVFVAFYFIYPGVSSQYLIWVLPFAFLADDRYLNYFLVFGTMALLSFYALYHPYIIFGRFGLVIRPMHFLAISELIFLSAFWLLCPFWGLSLFRYDSKRKTDDLI